MKQHHLVLCAIVGANLTAFTLHSKPVHSSLDCPQPLQQLGSRINDVRSDLRAAEDKALREYWGEQSPFRRLVRPPTAEESAALDATAPYSSAATGTQSPPVATGSRAPISHSLLLNGESESDYQSRRRAIAQQGGY